MLPQHTPYNRLRRGLILLYVLYCTVLSAFVVWTSLNERDQAEREARHQTASLARALEEHAVRSLISAEQAIQNIAEDIARHGGVDNMDEKLLHEVMHDRIRVTPQIRGIIAISPKGIVKAPGLEYPARPIRLEDRDYFKYHAKNTDLKPFFGQTILSRSDGKWLIPMTQRINKPDGDFGGIILIGLEPQYFLNFYDSLHLAEDSLVVLIHRNGKLLLRYPFVEKDLGVDLTLQPFYRNNLLLQNNEVSEGTLLDSVNRYYAHRPIADLPLTVTAGLNRNVALSSWYQSLEGRTALLLAVLLVGFAGVRFALTQLKRLEITEASLSLTQYSVDQAAEMIFWVNQLGAIIYANDALCQASGYNQQEIKALFVWDLGLGQARDQWALRWQTHIGQSTRTHTDTTLHTRTRKLITVEASFAYFKQENSEHCCITVRDITARKLTENTLKQHRDNLREMVDARTAEISAILHATPLGVVMTVNRKVRFINPQFESMLGAEPGELIGKTLSSFLASDTEFVTTFPDFYEQLGNNQIIKGKIRLKRQDGSVFWAAFNSKALDANQPQKGVISIVEDITQTMAAEQDLKDREALKQNIIGRSPNGFILLDDQLQPVMVNPALARMLGINEQKPNPELMAELTRKLLRLAQLDNLERVHQLSDPSQPNLVEISLSMPDGRNAELLASIGGIFDEHGQLRHAFAFFTDIAAQKQVERTLIKAKEEAETISLAKSTFLANMSHELRTPMHAILSYSELGLVKTNTAEPAKLEQYFSRIQTSGKRLLALLNDLLDMSKLEAGKMRYNKQKQDLRETAHLAVGELLGLLKNKHVELVHTEGETPLLAEFDQLRMIQVMVNLLGNAIKFTHINTRIELTAVAEARLCNGKHAVGYTLRDHGPGVAEADRQTIFNLFNQSSSAELNKGGTGLGLAICRQILQDHQGEISVANHPEGGAIFTVLIPAAEPELSKTN